MQAQLSKVIGRFQTAERRIHQLVDSLPAERWALRSNPDRWSAAECVAHLNITSRAFVPLIRTALDKVEPHPDPARMRYRRDWVGWFFSILVGPIPRFGRLRIGAVRTPRPFVPQGDLPQADLIREFDELQDEQIGLVRASEGKRLDRASISSPFDPRVHYNLYSTFVILGRHQLRHVAQAEHVWD